MMSKYIKCTDGKYRSAQEYQAWIANLQELAEQEPNDLTEAERKALEKEGLL